MKNSKMLPLLVACALAGTAAPALAQEHYTAGNVLVCDQYRVKEGKADAYARYLRGTVVPQSEAAKKAGLIVDRAYFLKADGPASGWNYMSCIVYRNFAALDYDADREKKADAIAAAQFKTADKAKQDEAIKVRFDMRDFKGSTTIQEIVLKPLP
jgi:hypothetical protein